MHSVSRRHHLGHPRGKRMQEKDMEWREALGSMERFQLDLDFETKKYLKGQVDQITRKLGKWALVEVAQRAVKSDPLWQRRFNELQRRLHRNQAIVAIARRLLELVCQVLSGRQAYRHFSHERIAYKYLTWSWQLDEEDRAGLTRQQFVRYYLMRMGSGKELQRIALNPRYPRRIASEAKVLALRPELSQIE